MRYFLLLLWQNNKDNIRRFSRTCGFIRHGHNSSLPFYMSPWHRKKKRTHTQTIMMMIPVPAGIFFSLYFFFQGVTNETFEPDQESRSSGKRPRQRIDSTGFSNVAFQNDDEISAHEPGTTPPPPYPGSEIQVCKQIFSWFIPTHFNGKTFFCDRRRWRPLWKKEDRPRRGKPGAIPSNSWWVASLWALV